MKSKLKLIVSLLFVFILSGCNFKDTKDFEDMSLMELNYHNKKLIEENEDLKEEYSEYSNLSNQIELNEVIKIINYVNVEIVKSNVMITSESKTFFHTASVSSGSGTIIKEDNEYYYVLTNNHVVYSLGNRTSYYVYDYMNNEYNASLLFSDPNYDMALLRFKKKDELKVTQLAILDAKIDDRVIVIGQPLGQRNAIAFGKVLKYGVVECSDCNPQQSNIKYECIYYDAKTTNGNSGGMIINSSYELIGVVTFGFNDNFGKYMYGAGSPVSKVREFLTNNGFEAGDSNA